MAFWGVEVKPKKPFTLKFSDFQAPRLHLSQATLVSKKADERVMVKCMVGDSPALYLCSLLPGAVESCSLDIYFDDDVTFSVKGSSSVHLVGYYDGNFDGDESGEDVEDDGYSDEEESEDYPLEGFINDDDGDNEVDDEFYYDDEWSSEEEDTKRVPNSGVTIEEVTDDVPEMPANHEVSLVPVKGVPEKSKQGDAINGTVQSTKEANASKAGKPVSSSEDEDGFRLTRKRKLKEPDNVKATKKKVSKEIVELASAPADVHQADNADVKESKKKKKKKKKDKNASNASSMEQPNRAGETQERLEMPAKQDDTNKKGESEKLSTNENEPGSNKKGTVRTYPNGLEIENMAMGKPDGKQTTPGKKVGMTYTGKLKSNGKIFDSNVGRKPLCFRLGVGEVIKGWDIGVNGMRVGDRRRLTIPPDMAYGSKGVPGIPPNSWLVFDVALVEVK